MDTEQTEQEHTELTTQQKLDEVKQMLNNWNTLPPLTIDTNSVYSISSSAGAVGSPYSSTGSISYPNWITTTNGTGSYNWQDLSISPTTVGNNGISVTGENADITIQGKSLRDWMETVEQRLNILTVNPKLEQEWDELRELGDRYRELERQCQEKSEIWKKLKTVPKIKD